MYFPKISSSLGQVLPQIIVDFLLLKLSIKGIFIEVFTEDGQKGFATAFGGYISSWIIKNHFNRFLIGADARNLSLLYDQMYRASIPYSGQNGVVINTIAGIDLALWDLIGKNYRDLTAREYWSPVLGMAL